MREATGGRVSPKIMTGAGPVAIRKLAAHMFEWPALGETLLPRGGLDYVLSVIRDRIGNRLGGG